MYKNIFDSHAHYTDKAFSDDRTDMLGSLKESGICGVINCGADLESSKGSLALSQEYDYIYFALLGGGATLLRSISLQGLA